MRRLKRHEAFFKSTVYVQTDGGICEVEEDELDDEDTECLVKIERSSRQAMEERTEEIEDAALPKKMKTQLRKAVGRREVERKEQEAFQVDVSEAFSQPRVTLEAKKQGLRCGGSYDILTGYDLRLKKDLARMRRALHQDEPELLLCSPPCGPFSQLQHLNYPKMPVEKVVRIVSEGLQHVHTTVPLCRRLDDNTSKVDCSFSSALEEVRPGKRRRSRD